MDAMHLHAPAWCREKKKQKQYTHRAFSSAYRHTVTRTRYTALPLHLNKSSGHPIWCLLVDSANLFFFSVSPSAVALVEVYFFGFVYGGIEAKE